MSGATGRARAEGPSRKDKAPAAARKAAPDRDFAGDPFASAPAAAEPRPQATFEQLLKDAVPVTDLATLIEPLYARCDDKDDLPRRQCEGIRAFLLERLRARTFVAVADSMPDTSPYDATAKEIEVEVSGCLACVAPPVVAGEVRYVSIRPPQRVVAGKAIGIPLETHQLPMETRVRADRFLERVVPRLRVQHIFRVGVPFGEGAPAPGPGSYKGVTIVPVAHRIYDRCTGQVAAASPPSTAPVKVLADRTCPRKGTEELSQAEMAVAAQQATLPSRLTPKQVEAALAPVQERVHECYVEFQELGGTAKVQLLLEGPGKIAQITLAPPFDKSAIGVCIRSQIKSAVFPKFHGEPMRIDYAFQVN